MFGTDTNNQPQNTQTSTMGLANATPQVSASASQPAPTISTDTPAISSAVPQVSAPEFTPPDANGNILKEAPSTPQNPGDLATIKKEALEKLGPLVDKLEQTPEEKFKTLMMLIQASDDQALVSKAYNAANSITDENIKARALLDIINEINYFTSQSDKEEK